MEYYIDVSKYPCFNSVYFTGFIAMNNMSTFDLAFITELGILMESQEFASVVSIKKNHNATYDINTCKSVIYLKTGCASIHRKTDDALLYELKSPAILGLEQLLSNSCHYYIKVDGRSRLIFLEHSLILELIESNFLWKKMAHFMGATIEIMELQKHNINIKKGAYQTVKTSIENIWHLPVEKRLSTSIFTFIMHRHDISRSSIAKILHQLNKGGYIAIRRGILVNVTKLPERY